MYRFGHTAEESKGVAVQSQPSLDLMVDDELHVLVATPREGHTGTAHKRRCDKGPRLAQPNRFTQGRQLSSEGKQELLASSRTTGRDLVPLIAPLTLLKHHLNRYPVPD